MKQILFFSVLLLSTISCNVEKEKSLSCEELYEYKKINSYFDSIPDSLTISIADVATIDNWIKPIAGYLDSSKYHQIIDFVRNDKKAYKIWGNYKNGILYRVDFKKISFTEKRVNALIYYQGKNVSNSKPGKWLSWTEVEKMQPICNDWYHVIYIEKTRGF